MKLKKINIQNFRSIHNKDIEIKEFGGKFCQMFFGINETGKSNILKAVRLFDKKAQFSYESDCEKQAKKTSEPVKLTFQFDIESYELNEVTKDLDLSHNLIKQIKIKSIEKLISYDDKSQRSESYNINFSGKTQLDGFYINSENTKIFDIEEAMEEGSDTAEIIKKFEDSTKIPLTEDNLKYFLLQKLTSKFDGLLPEIIFWQSSDNYLINQPVNLEDFKRDQNISIPLRNIFYLIGLEGENLVKNIDRIKKDTEEREELEEKLSEVATKHLNTLWPEHKVDIGVRIEKDGFCEVSVSDKDFSKTKFKMDQRSDGFKQFVSILLTLSVENKIERLKNKIILLDEPERSLHPSSIRYLRNELLNISQNNVILIASHSIFIVDKKNLDRHLIVGKSNNKTWIRRVDQENPYEDEIIYEALGTSIYELIEPYIIIFEGRNDKYIFDVFTEKFKKEIKPERIKSISASGVKEIRKYVKFFNQKMVTGIVVVDSDEEGKTEKKHIIQNNPSFKGTTFELKDLVNLDKDDITIEDLFPVNILIEEATKLYGNTFSVPNETTILKHLKKEKDEKGIHEDYKFDELKKIVSTRILEEIKSKNINELKQIYPDYSTFLISLHEKIKEIQGNIN